MFNNPRFTIPLGWAGVIPITMNPVVDITGYTLQFTVVSQLPQTFPALLTLTPAIISAPAGTMQQPFTEANTVALGVGTFYWSVWRTDASSQDELARGSFIIVDTARRY